MPRQNRSDPSGTLHAVPHKGTLMGNRGRLHKGGQIVRHRNSTARWISCTLEPVFGKRKVMGDSYTEIFFLDEVTALAAGHRPCAQCSRERYSRFVEAWRSADLPTSGRMAETMDRTLDIDRRATERPEVDVRNLPDGCVVRDPTGGYFAVLGGSLRRWSFDGYGPPLDPRGAGDTFTMVTPDSILRVP
jgi:hypothetical protein